MEGLVGHLGGHILDALAVIKNSLRMLAKPALALIKVGQNAGAGAMEPVAGFGRGMPGGQTGSDGLCSALVIRRVCGVCGRLDQNTTDEWTCIRSTMSALEASSLIR